MTNLLERFVDFATGEVTADVDNASVQTTLASITETSTAAGLDGTNQTISNSTITKVNLDTNVFEDSQVVTVDLPNNQLVVQESGTYLVIARLRWANDSGWSTGDLAQVRIHINGSTEVVNEKVKISTERELAHILVVTALSAADTVDMRAFQNSGNPKDLNAISTANRIEVARLG